MSKEVDVHEVVVGAIRKCAALGAAEVPSEARFEDLGVSSLDFITIVYEIEDAFDLEIVDAGLDGFRTVGDAVRLVEDLLAARRQTAPSPAGV